MSANDRQVGGSHYKNGELEHWDVITDYGVGYLEGCATKYVARWRKKDGVKDLQKSLHYCQKLRELADNGYQPRGVVPIDVVDKFVEANGLNQHEHVALLNLLRWTSSANIAAAEAHITILLEAAA